MTNSGRQPDDRWHRANRPSPRLSLAQLSAAFDPTQPARLLYDAPLPRHHAEDYVLLGPEINERLASNAK